MPTYEYECADCGPFSENRPMAEFDRPQACPDCGAMASRLLTMPALGGSAQEAATGASPVQSHAGGCACCMPRRLTAEAV